MKKFTSSGNGGAPVHKEDLRTIFNDELWDVLESMFSQHLTSTEGVIVSGCVISGGGPYDISEGIVFLDGEFMRLPAQTGQTLPKYIKAAASVNDTRTFADGSSGVVAVTKAAELAGSSPGTQYIAITSTTDPDDRRLKPVLGANQSIKTKVIEIGDWNMNQAVAGSNTKNIAHGLDLTKIKSVDVKVRNDAGTAVYSLSGYSSISADANGHFVNAGNVVGVIVDASIFDSTDFDSTGYNRGWVTVTYQE
jgi:hypothetical protein